MDVSTLRCLELPGFRSCLSELLSGHTHTQKSTADTNLPPHQALAELGLEAGLWKDTDTRTSVTSSGVYVCACPRACLFLLYSFPPFAFLWKANVIVLNWFFSSDSAEKAKHTDAETRQSHWQMPRHLFLLQTKTMFRKRLCFLIVLYVSSYWAIQAGLLTPLTFARHRLSPLVAFTSGWYFLHNERRWQWICEFYTANFKGIFGGP